jgi:hypothetical protein
VKLELRYRVRGGGGPLRYPHPHLLNLCGTGRSAARGERRERGLGCLTYLLLLYLPGLKDALAEAHAGCAKNVA